MTKHLAACSRQLVTPCHCDRDSRRSCLRRPIRDSTITLLA
jgi:hypothetical protein